MGVASLPERAIAPDDHAVGWALRGCIGGPVPAPFRPGFAMPDAPQDRQTQDGEPNDRQGSIDPMALPAALQNFIGGCADVAYFAADAAPFRFTYVTSNIEALTGHSAEALLRESGYFRAHVDPGDLAVYDAALERLQVEETAHREYRLRRPDGEIVWLREDLRIAGTGEPAGIVGSMVDISTRKQAQSDQAAAEALHRSIVESAFDAMIAVDATGKVVAFNPAAERLFGHAQEGAIGRDVAALLVPAHNRRRLLAGMRRYLDTGSHPLMNRRLVMDLVRSDGQQVPVEVAISTVSVQGSAVFLADIRDVRERLRAVRENRRLNQLLREAIESLPSGFAIFDRDRQLVACNTAFARLLGKSPHQLVGASEDAVHRSTLAHLQSFAGKPVEDPNRDLDRSIERLRAEPDEPFDAQARNGAWLGISRHVTADGGSVLIHSDLTQVKAAELSLRETVNHFRRIVEGLPVPAWMANADNAVVRYFSPAAAELLGLEAHPDRPVRTSDIFAGKPDRGRLLKALRKRGELRDYEVRLRKADGTTFWAALTCRMFIVEGREVIVSTAVDLTERKQREAELSQAREILEDAIESLGEGFALYDAEDRLVMCNSRYREFNSRSADMLVPGIKWADFIRAGAERGQYVNAIGRVEEWLRERRRQRRQENRQLEVEQSDGRWMQISNRRTPQGNTVAIRTDVSHLKHMEQALRESEERLRLVVEGHPIPVLLTRADTGGIIYASPAARDLLNLDIGALARMTLREFFRNAEDWQHLWGKLGNSGFVDDEEVELQKGSGEPFWASVAARMITYGDGQAIVCNVRDLTERRAVEAEMQRQREALYQSEKLSAFGTLLAGIAHELNNPLSVVVGQATLMQETVSDPTISRRANKIADAADRCSRIVKTFLAMARDRRSTRSTVDLNKLVTGTLDVTGYGLRTQDIDVESVLASDLPTVSGDADQLSQVLTNLVINAQQALAGQSPPRRLRIETRIDSSAKQVEFVVEDNGPGVPPGVRSRIFEPFFTTKEVGVGTGIGLAVCQRIIDSHGGTITLDSGRENGARFTVRLPAEPISAPLAAEPVNRSRSIRGQAVLVIDDEEDIGELIREILMDDGHAVITARSGSEALQRLEAGDFDAIISDLRMPELDGPGLFKHLMAQRPELLRRTAFITGDSLGATARDFLRTSGRPYIEKPFSPEELRDLVGRLLAENGVGEEIQS